MPEFLSDDIRDARAGDVVILFDGDECEAEVDVDRVEHERDCVVLFTCNYTYHVPMNARVHVYRRGHWYQPGTSFKALAAHK